MMHDRDTQQRLTSKYQLTGHYIRVKHFASIIVANSSSTFARVRLLDFQA